MTTQWIVILISTGEDIETSFGPFCSAEAAEGFQYAMAKEIEKVVDLKDQEITRSELDFVITYLRHDELVTLQVTTLESIEPEIEWKKWTVPAKLWMEV